MPHRSNGSKSSLPEGPISDASPDEIRGIPYNMPDGFEWGEVDVKQDTELEDLYKLLSNNYVEDDDALFRFDYSPEFLLWALTPPGYKNEYLIGVKSAKTKKLIAFISGIPATLRVYDKIVQVVEINFLCVHKKLRSKRLAPVLIKEMTRRANLNGVFQAVYTAGTLLPVPVSSARYYHRSLNPKKLLKVGFSRLPNNGRVTVARMCKMYALPEQPKTPNLRLMEKRDVTAVHQLLTEYLKKYDLTISYTPEDVEHWFLPRDKVIDSYVAENDENHKDAPGKITDFISFYHLPSSILNHNDTLYAAYSYYNIANTVPLEQLVRDALILAKAGGSDVFNALDLMDNLPTFETLKFGIGDGTLQYYIYNWACPDMAAKKVGLVLL
jgi:glycylpeptide N-tetradecanoyltransferase